MKDELKPQQGDIFIESSIYGYGWKIFIWESDWRGWQDKLGYITRDEKHARSLIQGMDMYREDDNGRRFYRTQTRNANVQESVTPVVDVPTHEREETIVSQRYNSKQQITVGSYTRTITTKTVTFKCAHCGTTVTQEKYPGPKSMYCTDACKKAVQREQTKLRVHRLRAGKKAGSQ